MSSKIKKKPHSPEFKFKVAIEAIRGEKTTAELCQEFGVVNSQIFKWKKALLEGGKQIFTNPLKVDHDNAQIDKLHAKIGRLTVENDFLAKFAGRSQ